MPRTPRHLGDSLVALTEQLPTAHVDEIWTAERDHPAETAVDTPFLTRMRALLAAIDAEGPIGVAQARRTLCEAAPMEHLLAGSSTLFESVLLGAALRRDLLRCTEVEEGVPALWSTTAAVDRGAHAHEVVGHPLAAVIEPWIDEMMRDPVADLDCDPRLSGPWVWVPFLLVQLLATAGEVDLSEAARAIRREAGALTRKVRLPWPVQNTVVGLVVGQCVEFGVATWDGDMRALGRAEITPLGLLAQLALRAHVEGELPPGFMEAYHQATMPAHTWN